MESRTRKVFFVALTILVFYLPLILLAIYVVPRLFDDPAEVDLAGLSEADREQVYARLAADVGGIWDATPEPLVGRLLQRGISKTFKQAPLSGNNAGLRDSRPYGPKPDDVFRIVLLGDSFVMGTGGIEQDRVGNQMEELLGGLPVAAGGKRLEVYSIGLGGWNTVAEASYLTSRLSAYSPDLIIVLIVSNDITDNNGVTGIGSQTRSFSPNVRALGSGNVTNMVPRGFGLMTNLVYAGLGPTSASMWAEAFGALKRLEDLQTQRGGKLLLSFLVTNPARINLFGQNVLHYADELGIRSPRIVTSYFRSKETKLPHDDHPNRTGHRILAVHYLHVLAALSWISVEPGALPPLHENLSTESALRADERKRRAQRRTVAQKLPSAIDFSDLGSEDAIGFLGGFLRGARGAPGAAPGSGAFGTVRSVFLLKNTGESSTASVTVEVPPKAELFPFTLALEVHGVATDTLHLEDVSGAGTYTLQGPVPSGARDEPALEIKLLANRYWCEIDRRDEGMRSFRFVSASVR